jgi:hypothetical protein
VITIKTTHAKSSTAIKGITIVITVAILVETIVIMTVITDATITPTVSNSQTRDKRD